MQVLRDGKWSEQDAVILVPGDIISIKLGDIVPADARLLEGDPLKIDQVCTMSSIVLALGNCQIVYVLRDRIAASSVRYSVPIGTNTFYWE